MCIKCPAQAGNYIGNMTTSATAPGLHHSSEPLADFSQCHVGILSKLEAFKELPALQAAAAQARTVAAQTLALFEDAVCEHHADEERELFPAVLRSAMRGEESDFAQAMVLRLTAEHRHIETLWKKIEPAVKAVAKSRAVDLDLAAVESLVRAYTAHARFEEEHFLPLAQTVLGRNRNHMDALDLSLHLRHTPAPLGHI
jgi:hemerythrin-like domain-containing protein